MSALTAVDAATDLGRYLMDRRMRLDPAALGLSLARRRTKGLRREEVALRAAISPTWYTWLEQGRGGTASADVLERIAEALLLTAAERDHLFLLGLGRLPPARYAPPAGVSPRLQRVLDRLHPCPAVFRTAAWDVVAWNRAAALVLTDYGTLPPSERNVLRLIFLRSHVRDAQDDWETTARFVVSVFRADAARAGASAAVTDLIAELRRDSPDFERIWCENDVRDHDEGIKRFRHPVAGPLAFEYSAFAVDGRPDLALVVYSPLTDEDDESLNALLTGRHGTEQQSTAAQDGRLSGRELSELK